MSFTVCKIKNIDSVDHSILGTVVSAGGEYTVSDSKRIAISTNDSIIQKISEDKLQVGDGTQYFSSYSKQIDWLKNSLPTQVQTIAVNEPNGKRARLIGCIFGTATANSTTNHDWTIPQMQYPVGTDVDSVFDGIQYYVKDSTLGDNLTFEVIDKDGSGVSLGLYPQAYYDAYKDGSNVLIVEEFGTNWYVAPNKMEDIILYKAKLYPGLCLRVKFQNIHASNDVEFFINLFRHLDIQD